MRLVFPCENRKRGTVRTVCNHIIFKMRKGAGVDYCVTVFGFLDVAGNRRTGVKCKKHAGCFKRNFMVICPSIKGNGDHIVVIFFL